MNSATNIELVNIFYSTKAYDFNNNQFTGEDIQKHNENTSDINLLLVKTKLGTDAYVIKDINMNTNSIGGEIKHIGDKINYKSIQIVT